jgi:hypothetical protein
MRGQQTWEAAQEPWVPGPVQNLPGDTGVRQCLASGQQYEPRSLQGETQGEPARTDYGVS